MSSDVPGRAPLLALSRRNLPLLLLRAREDVLARFRPILNEQGLTEQQWRVLRVLAEREPASLEPRQIGELCGISSPSLTGVLARMDETGLVARRRVAADQRRLLVTLTAKSRAIVRRIAPQVEREYAALEAAVGAALIGDLYAVLDRLDARLRGPLSSASAGDGRSTFGPGQARASLPAKSQAGAPAKPRARSTPD